MLLTIPQAAGQLDLSRQRVWLLVSQGRIKAQQIGQAWLISERELARFSATRTNGGRPRKDARK